MSVSDSIPLSVIHQNIYNFFLIPSRKYADYLPCSAVQDPSPILMKDTGNVLISIDKHGLKIAGALLFSQIGKADMVLSRRFFGAKGKLT